VAVVAAAASAKTEQQRCIGAVAFDREQFAGPDRAIDAADVDALGLHQTIGRDPPVVRDVVAFARPQRARPHVGGIDQFEHDLAVDDRRRREIFAIRRDLYAAVLIMACEIRDRDFRGNQRRANAAQDNRLK